MPQTYAEALSIFEQLHKTDASQEDQERFKYYQAMFKHELTEFEENFTKWEVGRVY